MSVQPTAPELLCVLGATATGKTRFAVALARSVGRGEVLSADSRQVFRGMDVGTGKDLAEYRQGGPPVPVHLVDIAEAGTEYSLFEYQRAFLAALRDVRSRGGVPILCGGSGLYLEAVLQGYDLAAVPRDDELRRELASLGDAELVTRLERLGPLHNTTDTRDRDRLVRAIEIGEHSARAPAIPFPEIRTAVFGLRLPRTVLRRRITERLKTRLDGGLIEEVRRLLTDGIPAEQLERYGLEYRYVSRHVRGELDRMELAETLSAEIRRFAKRQETWFRRMERRGTRITWLDATRPVPELVDAARTDIGPIG